MDSHPAYYIVQRDDRLIPGTDRDAPSATGGPFLFVHRPECQASLSVDVPLFETRIIVNTHRLVCRGTKGNGVSRTVNSAVLTGHAKFVHPEGDRLVYLKWQVGSDQLDSHIDAEFGGQNSAVTGKLTDSSIESRRHYLYVQIG